MAQTAKKENFIQWFIRKWKSSPIFSTGCVLVLMVILQTVALGFRDASFGAWLQRWGKNWINILRNNAGVGIVALGMTFVIISGGIDLAVGSTMVAIGAVLMVIINGYPAGLLTAVGITGVPAYLIGILAAVLIATFMLVIRRILNSLSSVCWLLSCTLSASAVRAGTTLHSDFLTSPASFPHHLISGPHTQIHASG